MEGVWVRGSGMDDGDYYIGKCVVMIGETIMESVVGFVFFVSNCCSISPSCPIYFL